MSDTPKPAQEQYDSMRANLEEGRLTRLAEGVPSEFLVFVVRNNNAGEDDHKDFDRMGSTFECLDGALDLCKCVLRVGHLYSKDLFDVHAVDGRDYERLQELLEPKQSFKLDDEWRVKYPREEVAWLARRVEQRLKVQQ